MAVYVKIDGIKGGATEKTHKEWVKVDSLQFGVGRSLNDPYGHATSREAGFPKVSEVHVTKNMDNSSILLFGWAVGKFDAKQVKIDVVSTGRGDSPFTTYTLENAVISGYSIASHGESLPTESITFNFTKIVENFVTINADMTPGNPINKGFDLALGVPV
jgi:type VI secretion system secreted protein Hcp